MSRIDAETLDGIALVPRRSERAAAPGGVVLFGGGAPRVRLLPGAPGEVSIQRETLAAVELADGRVSRRHADCRWTGEGWRVRDLGSRNGTSVDGRPCEGEVVTGPSAIVRVGDVLVRLTPDAGVHEERPLHVDRGVVVGATFGDVLDQVARAASGSVLHLTGPSGAGKEVAARAFHARSAMAKGPFVAINCAAIPEGVAERVLFGAKKGSYSGAHADAIGHLQEASGGTLFLDEVGELDLSVQGKLLRALEAREIIPVGASLPVPVDVRFCSATHRDLRQAVAERTFREDLYFRIGRPAVVIPPLAARREEIPVLVHREIAAHGLAADASLVEACLLRPWPGNVRELKVELGVAARAAAAAGDGRVRAGDLAAHAGLALSPVEPSARAPSRPPSRPLPRRLPGDDVIEEALRRSEGRVASAARELGVHRNQLRRWLAARGRRSS